MADFKLRMKRYVDQVGDWPTSGNHIIGQAHENTVVVYQAVHPLLADWAVKNGKFGGPHYNGTRMTWIKTNFMWMMHRSNRTQSPNQESILAIHISREGFKEILRRAHTVEAQREAGLKEVEVQLQWQPDHGLKGEKLLRRVIQLGMMGNTVKELNELWIGNIQDVTAIVEEQREKMERGALEDVVIPEETVFGVDNEDIERQIVLSYARKKIILCFGGSFNPIHRNHIDVMLKAKEWLEMNTSFEVVEGILVVSSEEYVNRKFKRSPGRVIRGEHRLELCRLAIEGHGWIKVHPTLCVSASQIGKPYGERGIYVGIIKGGDKLCQSASFDAMMASLPSAPAFIGHKLKSSINWRNLKKNPDPFRVDVVIGRGDDILDVHKQFEEDNEKGLVENKQFYIVPESVGDLSSTKMREILDRKQRNLKDVETRNELEVFINKEGVDYIINHFDHLFIE